MGINPDRGTKAAKTGKKQHHISPKVLQLTNALKDFETDWSLE
jgi:hypothetical protein